MDKDGYFDWSVYIGLIRIHGSIPELGSMRGHLLSRGATKKGKDMEKTKKKKLVQQTQKDKIRNYVEFFSKDYQI